MHYCLFDYFRSCKARTLGLSDSVVFREDRTDEYFETRLFFSEKQKTRTQIQKLFARVFLEDTDLFEDEELVK